MAKIEPTVPHTEPNFFTAEEYESIYKTINDTMELGVKDAGDKWHHFKKLTNNGFIAVFLSERRQGPLPGLSQMVEDKIRRKFNEKAGAEVDHIGILWARYTLESGMMPTLMPHQDRSETHVAYMFTIELDKNLDSWDFYVEDEKFEMNKNQAIWFSGTHQSHWRPDKIFKEGEYYDILLCQTHHPDDEYPLDEEFFLDGDDHSNDVAQKYSTVLMNSLAKAAQMNGPCQ
jgi:hypothetical protein